MSPAAEVSVWAGWCAGGTWAVSGVSGKSLDIMFSCGVHKARLQF